MTWHATVGSIRWPSEYGIGGTKGPEFIQYVDILEPQIHEVWDFSFNAITLEVHLTEQVDFGTGVVGGFTSDYLTESGRRFLILGQISINVSVEYLGIPNFHRIGGPFWASNLLAPRSS